MKTFGKFIFILALVGGLSAQAIYNPKWERPIFKAELTEVFGHELFRFPVAEELTLHQRDGAKDKTLFSLVEDTGLRCITTPCPSHVTSLFTITKIQKIDAQTVKYFAKELPRVDVNGSIYNGLRKLEVVDFVGERQQWNLTIKEDSRKARKYVGYPEGVPTIESIESIEE